MRKAGAVRPDCYSRVKMWEMSKRKSINKYSFGETVKWIPKSLFSSPSIMFSLVAPT